MKHISSLRGKLLIVSYSSYAYLIPNLSRAQILPAPYNVEAIFTNDIVPIVDVTWDHDADSVLYFIVERDGFRRY